MGDKIEEIKENLINYPFIKYYLGDIINQRALIENHEYGMLTGHLLESSEDTRTDLKRLEKALQLGNEHCTDFQVIFEKERKLTEDPEVVDAEIINLLAEVKAFEVLNYHKFVNITKMKRSRGIKMVDFCAKRNYQNYAIEVTRLGIATSDKKKPQVEKSSRMPWFTVIDSNKPQNKYRVAQDIYDEISAKYSQIQRFSERQTDIYKGMLIISNGRDYFAMSRFEDKRYEYHPRNVADVLKQLWESIGEQENLKYLNYVVITMGKNVKTAVVYPELERSEQIGINGLMS